MPAPEDELIPRATNLAGAYGSYGKKNRRRFKRPLVFTLVTVVLVVVALLIYGIVTALNSTTLKSRSKDEPPDPEDPLPPSYSKLRVFKSGAVCTDGPVCSEIGNKVLQKNGSAVDAAVAAIFCNGLYNMQSMGMGGGFFMTVFIRDERKSYSVNARESAPGMAHKDMFRDLSGSANQVLNGSRAVAVPGEVRGMWAAHKRWGSLPWAELLQPSIDLCNNGFNVSKVLYESAANAVEVIKMDTNLRKTLYNEKTQAVYKEGELIKVHTSLCDTLERIAKNGGDDLYTGSLSKDLLDDLNQVGSIITADDLAKYEAKITESVAVPLKDGDTLFTPPPPSSGILLGFILNILSGYKFNQSSIQDINSTILTYHRVIEAFKFTYATRTRLGDADFVNLTQLIANISSTDYAEQIRQKINDSVTFNDAKYYGAEYSTTEDHGTAHISIVAPNGDAVSMTSSINYYFGVGFTAPRTGIILNNVMDDFSMPNVINYFGIKPSPANFIQPYKRPLSSMSPAVIVDKNNEVKMAIGASGGTKITTAVALVVMKKLWFEQDLKESVDTPRLHHQLLPMTVEYEYGNLQDIVQGLRMKGHEMKRYRDRGSIVCALFKNTTGIYGNADFRKGGDVFGFD